MLACGRLESLPINHCSRAVLRNGPNRIAKWPILRAKTAHFTLLNGPFCNALIISVVHFANAVAYLIHDILPLRIVISSYTLETCLSTIELSQ